MVVSWQSDGEYLQGDLLWHAESEVFAVEVIVGLRKQGVRDDYVVFRFCEFFGLRDPERAYFLYEFRTTIQCRCYSEYSAGIEEVVVFVLRGN